MHWTAVILYHFLMLFRSIHTSVISGKWDTTVGCWLYIITHIDFHTSQNHFSTQLFNSISMQGAVNTHTNHMHMLTFVDLAAVILDSLCLIRAVRTAFLKWLHRYPWLNRDLIFEINIWSFSFMLSFNCTLSEAQGILLHCCNSSKFLVYVHEWCYWMFLNLKCYAGTHIDFVHIITAFNYFFLCK